MTVDYDFRRFEVGKTVSINTLKHIIDHVPVPCVLRDMELHFVHINNEMIYLFELEGLEEYTENWEELSPPYQPDGSPSNNKFRALLNDVIEQGLPIKMDWLYCRKDKELMPMTVTLIRIEVEGKYYVLKFLQDVRESRRVRIAESVARQRLQAMMDSCPITSGLIDEHFNVLEVNNEVLNLFGILNKQTFTDRFFELSPEYQPDGQLSRRKALDKLKQTFEAGRIHYEWLHQSIYGDHIPCEVTLVRVNLNDQDMAIIYIQDLRELKKSIAMMEKMESIAYTDELTQLYNRRYFMENAAATLKVNKEKNIPFHLLMIDLDHFKGVNDTYGHSIGDEVLRITAKRMSGVTRKDNIIARYGGEEFIIMLTGMDHEGAVKNAQRIQKAMEESAIVIKGMSLNVTVSVGVATLSDNNETLDDIIHMADMALYGAKRTGRNKVVEYEDIKDMKW